MRLPLNEDIVWDRMPCPIIDGGFEGFPNGGSKEWGFFLFELVFFFFFFWSFFFFPPPVSLLFDLSTLQLLASLHFYAFSTQIKKKIGKLFQKKKKRN